MNDHQTLFGFVFYLFLNKLRIEASVCVSEFGICCRLIGRSCSDPLRSTPEPQPADPSIRGNDQTHVADGLSQRQLGLAVEMSVMRTELQQRQRDKETKESGQVTTS